MDRKTSKQQISDRYADLRRSQATEVGLFRQLMMLEYEDAKERLVRAVGDQIPTLQGQASAFDKIYKNLVQGAPLEQERNP